MLIAFTARAILQVLIIAFFALVLLHVLWPWLLARSLIWDRRPHNRVRGLLARHAGTILFGVAALFAVALYVGFVGGDDDLGWWDPEPALTSLAITFGVAFGYTRLFPPPFFPAFHPDVDPQTGNWSDETVEELTIAKRQWVPIFLVIHNTGIASWNNYRITVRFEDGFDIVPDRPEIPASTQWGWNTKDLRIIRERCSVQLQADNTLAVAEPQTLRFVVRSHNHTGRSKIRIALVCDGRLSESRREIRLNIAQ